MYKLLKKLEENNDNLNIGRLLRLSELLYRELSGIDKIYFLENEFTHENVLKDEVWDSYMIIYKEFYDTAYNYFPLNNTDFIKIRHILSFGTLEKFGPNKNLSIYINRCKKNILYSKNNEYIITPKLDGISARIFYIDGEFLYSTNRGKDNYGLDISSKIKDIIPQKINNKDKIAIRGELIYIGKNIKTTARNTISGILINSKETLKDCIFIPYEVVNFDKKEFEFNNFIDQYKFLKDNKFILLPYLIKDIKDINNDLNKINLSIKNISNNYILSIDNNNSNKIYIETDGLVIQPLNYVYENKDEPKFQIAFKFTPDIIKESTILSISYNCKFRHLTPIININPVNINNKNISKITGSNINYLINNKYFIGSIVTVGFSNDVIPKIFSVIKEGKNKNIYPIKCPICNSKLNDSYDCINNYCPSIYIIFIEKLNNIYNIKGLGTKKILDYSYILSKYMSLMNDPKVDQIHIPDEEKNILIDINIRINNLSEIEKLSLNYNYSLSKIEKNNITMEKSKNMDDFSLLISFIKTLNILVTLIKKSENNN